jgi:hypothetical protein
VRGYVDTTLGMVYFYVIFRKLYRRTMLKAQILDTNPDDTYNCKKETADALR